MIFVVRVAAKQERMVALMLEKKARSNDIPLYSIFVPENVKGYIFLETDTEDNALKIISNVKYVKGLLKSPVSIDDVRKMLVVEEKKEEKVDVGDIVEIISGPFKGENAKVTRIDEAKDECVVLPLDVAISMPIKIKMSYVKLVKKAGEE